MSTFDVVAFIISMSWESVQDSKYYHTRFNVGTDLNTALEMFHAIAWKGIPIREDNDMADGWVILFGVTSWTNGDNDGPVMVRLNKHEWSRP